MVRIIRKNSSQRELEEYRRQYRNNVLNWILGILVCIGGCYVLIPPLHGPGHASASRKYQSKNNLKQIGLAIHNYHDVHKVIPSLQVPVDHGWALTLLPYLDQATLYEQVDRSVSWNHPKNQFVYATKIDAFANPLATYENITGYAPNHYAGNSRVILADGLPISEIIDGTSNTLLAGEVSKQFQPWGEPHNLRDPALGLHGGPNQFGGLYSYPKYEVNGAQMLMADGSVQFLSEDIDAETLRRLADPRDGDAVGEF